MVNAAEAGQEEKDTDSLANQALMDSSIPSGGASQIRVMICDGHEAVRRALRIRLSVPEQLEIIGVCRDPDEAADLIRFENPDVVLLGLHRSSDQELACVVRFVNTMSSNATKVIVLAPYSDAVEREMLLNAGAKRYLLKHINSDQLIQEIESVVAGMPGGD